MNFLNDANLDPATWLLFEVLQTACIPANDDVSWSAGVCLKQYKKQFHAAVQMLVWLQFAIPNRRNALGCNPTDALMTLIARKPKRWLQSKRTTQLCEHRDAMESIIESALKKDALDETLQQCAVNVVGTLGLVRRHEKLERAVPTGRLTNLAAMLRTRERADRYSGIRHKQAHRDSHLVLQVRSATAPMDGIAE